MLDDSDGRFVKLGHKRCGCADIHNVVERQLLAVELFKCRRPCAVERRALMRIFAVPEIQFARGGQMKDGRKSRRAVWVPSKKSECRNGVFMFVELSSLRPNPPAVF